MSQKNKLSPALFAFHLDRNKKIIHERRAKDAAAIKYREDIELKESLENQKILQSILSENPHLVAKNIHTLTIPSGLSRSIPITEERLEIYSKHLKSIISKAACFADAAKVTDEIFEQNYENHDRVLKVEQLFANQPLLKSMSNQLCALCKGGCCPVGGDHAYLSVVTMRCYLDTHPDLSEQDVLDLYLSKISTKSIAGACINQTREGCVLPREMRSDVCNGFYCAPLKSYHKEYLIKGEKTEVLAIQRSHTHWNRFDPDEENEVVNVVLLGDKKLS
ncbi:MAG: hypothetical protein GQ583_00390 [Methyloprofundus sp.]|nr:hypothetical protein [Methyloprofundus sp.]